ncbi:hypothetical protein EJD97_021811 [Solanum chilense]|uniref:Uncharacterized protein n=1 Tax=Solanum chilense TaxID=4083 RepID=A0A6N2CC44_SOLCI|nr:hypothetical protein EJD97_021811 [Solanum chilense]
MTALRCQAKSTSNPSIIAAFRTARYQVTILSTAMGERQWRSVNQKNMAVKVRLAFSMSPFSSSTQ